VDLTPEERLLAALVRLSIRDALQHRNAHIRREAASWLWWICPAIAARAGVPRRKASSVVLVPAQE
jgi:hypothetical protein